MTNQLSRLPGGFGPNDQTEATGAIMRAGEEAASRAQAEIQASYVMALRNPRNLENCKSWVEEAFKRRECAEEAHYSFPRGGATVEGPSVALARECARSWGNIRSGFRIVDANEREFHIVGWALDLERNIYDEADDRFGKQQQRKDKRTGETRWVTADERDLREILNKRGAIAQRNALLKVLPSWLVKLASDTAYATMRGGSRTAAAEPIEKQRQKAVDAFEREQIPVAMLERKIGKPVNQWTEADVDALRKLYKALEESHMTIEEAFPDGDGSEQAVEAPADAQAASPAPEAPKRPATVADVKAGRGRRAKTEPEANEEPATTSAEAPAAAATAADPDASERAKVEAELKRLTHGHKAGSPIVTFVFDFCADAGAKSPRELPLTAPATPDGFEPSLKGLLRDLTDAIDRKLV